MKGDQPMMHMLDAKADIDAAQPTGYTTFHYACFCGAPNCAEALVLGGCDKGLRTKGGKTGRDLAVQNKQRGLLLALKRLTSSHIPGRDAYISRSAPRLSHAPATT